MKLETEADRERFLFIVRQGALPLDVDCKSWKAPRTDEQNAALWGVAYKTLHLLTGNDPDDLHDYFCGEHFGWVESDVMGQRKRRPLRTTTVDEKGRKKKLNTTDFAAFYDFIQQRSAENGYYVPDPDPMWRQRREAA